MVQPCNGRGLQQSLWTGPQAARQNHISRIPNRLDYCVIYSIYIIHKCDNEPHYTAWRVVGWSPMIWMKIVNSVIYQYVVCSVKICCISVIYITCVQCRSVFKMEKEKKSPPDMKDSCQYNEGWDTKSSQGGSFSVAVRLES